MRIQKDNNKSNEIKIRKKAYEVIRNMEIATNPFSEIPLDMAPLGSGYVNDDYIHYYWFRPKNKKELKALCTYFHLRIPMTNLKNWICIETQNTIDEYEEEMDENYIGISFKDTMKDTISFWASLGYEIRFIDKK